MCICKLGNMYSIGMKANAAGHWDMRSCCIYTVTYVLYMLSDYTLLYTGSKYYVRYFSFVYAFFERKWSSINYQGLEKPFHFTLSKFCAKEEWKSQWHHAMSHLGNYWQVGTNCLQWIIWTLQSFYLYQTIHPAPLKYSDSNLSHPSHQREAFIFNFTLLEIHPSYFSILSFCQGETWLKSLASDQVRSPFITSNFSCDH